MLNVLVVSHEYPPCGGGAGVVAQDLCRGLSRMMNVTLITNHSDMKINEQFKVVLVKTIPKIRFLSYWASIKKIDLDKYDKIILNDIGSSLMASLFFSKKMMKKSIVYLHGSEPENIFINPEFMFKLLSFKYKYTTLLENCHLIVAVSDYMKYKFLELTNLDHLHDKINVIYNGVDLNVFNRVNSNVRELYNLSDDTKIIVSVSRIVEGKGYSEMYSIVRQLIIKHQKVFWLIIGSGGFSKELQCRIDSDVMSSNIKLLGQIPREDLKFFYSSADVFLLLSNFFESLGLVYLEANACGCPVIGNDRGGVSHIISNGVNGYKIPESSSDSYIINKIENVVFGNGIEKSRVLEFSENYSVKNSVEMLAMLLLR